MSSNGKVALLGYPGAQTLLEAETSRRGLDLEVFDQPLKDLGSFERVISFGYRHILKEAVLATAKAPVVNLHISLLPYNRGAHPNFWSWMEGSPSGVTVHEIDAGIDTGPIVAQKRVSIEPEGRSFRDTYTILMEEMASLFAECCSAILDGRYNASPQKGEGTFHRIADLPSWMTSWDMQISDAVARFRDGGG